MSGMKQNVSKILKNNIVVIALLLLVVIMSIVADTFFTVSNIVNIFTQIAIYGIVACAMTISIIGGEFDLSVSSLIGVITILFTDFSKNYGVLPAIAVCLAAGIVVGLINGFLVAKIKMSAFVATLSTMLSLKGFALTYTSGKPINYANNAIYEFGNGDVLGIPIIVLFFFGALLLTFFVLRFTRFGRGVYATGGNPMVAKMVGINVTFYKTMLFVILGVATAIAGILMGARLQSGNSLYGRDLTMSVVAGVVIGGTSLSGGRGSAFKTLWGMLVIGVLFNALMILGVQANIQDVVKGAILIAVVSTDAVFAQRKSRRKISPGQDGAKPAESQTTG